jgi:starch synthase
MTILFAASEVAPDATTGGLGEVLASLPRFLEAMGHDVVVVLPGYPALMADATPVDVQFALPVGDALQPVTVYEKIQTDGTQLLLIHNDALFGRPGIYGDASVAYPDNAVRFIFFSRAVVELAKRLQPRPSVLHLHDWQTALVPALVREQRLPLRTVLTLHNAAYQGAFPTSDFALTNLPSHWMAPTGLEFYGGLNLLKGGILTADALTTVSSTYRRELLSPEGGCGLHEVLQSRADSLHVIPNGVDPERWNPSPFFSAETPEGKLECRTALLVETGLRPNPTGPVFAMFARLADQKGFDVLLPLLPRLFTDDVRLIVAGDGSATLRRDLLAACRQHPAKFAFLSEWDVDFPKRLFAGADALLVPSHFEPCGLAPLNALRFGTVPVAHATGGLLENLADYDPTTGAGNALLYRNDSSAALWDALGRTGALFRDKTAWRQPVRNAMRTVFSWETSAHALDGLYRSLNA